MASRKVMRHQRKLILQFRICKENQRIEERTANQKEAREAENARLKREAELKEAHDLIQIAKSLSVTIEGQSVTVYDWLKRERFERAKLSQVRGVNSLTQRTVTLG